MSKYWPLKVYTEYVTKHASGDQRSSLFHPKLDVWDEDRFPGIIIAYHSMPEWMRYSQIISLNDRDLKFRQLTDMYQMDMRRYMSSVEGWLDQINRWQTGGILLAEINGASRRVTILPFRGTKPNAYEHARSFLGEINAVEKGAFVDPFVNPFDEDLEASARLKGTGRGADAIIEFTPDVLRSEMGTPGGAPDEYLFHELVHALRNMRGVMNGTFVSGGYDNQEEFIAVVLTNIYLSEKGQMVFRGDHDSRTLQGPAAERFLDNSQRLTPSPMQLMQNFRDRQLTFYNALAALPRNRPKFNPVQEHNERMKDWQRLHGRDRSTF